MERLANNSIRLFLTLAFVSLAPLTSYSQVTLQVGGGLGVLVPSGDYGGSTIDYYRGTKYGLSSAVNLHGKVRTGFVDFILFGEVDYASLSNREIITAPLCFMCTAGAGASCGGALV